MRVSVVIPTYNREPLILRALNSALNNIEGNDEIIVVDDGSTDSTSDTVRRVDDLRIRYIRQAHSGAGVARNRGTAEATGELVAYLDSDDEWLPGKLALQREIFAAREDVLFCFTNFIREYNGVLFRRDLARWHTDRRSWDEIMGKPLPYSAITNLASRNAEFLVYLGDIYHAQMYTNFILTSCLMVRRLGAGDAIRFGIAVKTYEDWECFGRLARYGVGAFLDCETAVQHSHSGPRLTDADYLTRIDARLAILRDVWGADFDFLTAHGEEYRKLVDGQLLLKARYLLGKGLSDDARRAIRTLQKVPPSLRFLAAIPQGVLRPAARARQWAKTTALGWISMSRTGRDL